MNAIFNLSALKNKTITLRPSSGSFTEYESTLYELKEISIHTPSLHSRLKDTGDYEKAKNDFIARQPLGRVGRADEIASLALYLSSDESMFTTGQTHIIDGGWSVG